jgi:hypothetical protein
LDARLENIEGQLESNLVVSLASVGDELLLTLARAITGLANEVPRRYTFSDDIHLNDRKAMLPNEFINHVFDVTRLCADFQCLDPRSFKVFLLANVGHEAGNLKSEDQRIQSERRP